MISGLMVAVALAAAVAQALPVSTVTFIDDPAWGTDTTFELDSESNGIVPCTNVQVGGTERQCIVRIARTTAQTVRLRAVGSSGVVSGWTAPFAAPVPGSGPLPGAPTIRGFKALP